MFRQKSQFIHEFSVRTIVFVEVSSKTIYGYRKQYSH